MTIRIALIGFGKIALDQHEPALARNDAFELVATVDPRLTTDTDPTPARLDDFNALLNADIPVDAVALCVPPQHRFALACQAIEAGLHVLLEKPPGISVSEATVLQDRAAQAGVTLYASWHSRHAPGIDAAREWLTNQTIRTVAIDWREDVTVFHPGQAWIWQAGGLGVFDPGINALSILTTLIDRPFALRQARLDIPGNCAMPIAATLSFTMADEQPIDAIFDFRHTGSPCWQIRIETASGLLQLDDGGARLTIDGDCRVDTDKAEYDGVYERFAWLIDRRESDVDLRPFEHVADAFLLGERRIVDDFHE